MKVLIITTEAPDAILGGLGFFHQTLWAELKKSNVDYRTLYLYTDKPSKAADYNLAYVNALPFDFGPDAKALGTAWTMRRAIDPILASFQPDVISCHEQWTALPFWDMMDMVQFTLHSSYIGLEPEANRTYDGLSTYWQQRFVIERAAVTVVHSEWAKAMVSRYVTRKGNVQVLTMGIDPANYSTEWDRQAMPVVSFFGRWDDPAKRYDLFIEQARRRPEYEWRVYAPTCPTDGAEFYKGFVQGEDKRRAFAQTDLVVMPSERESLGIVGLEAMMSGVPLWHNGDTGISEYGLSQPYTLSETVGFLADTNKRDESRRMAMSMAEYAAEYFNAERMADAYIKAWEAIANR